ncbi:transcription repressor OFP8-like [Ipomoea triloba]|uniref:transcription repressor OFP8-like n=1 Tax=Ipomoea triloba TaxID=35885 RepID=UPI00125D51B6|nr:transcription repressor OFP8-like [Ipomoea triloba]
MMENHKVSRFFPSSFTSCRLRTLTDVVQSSISAARNRHENQFPKINLAGDGDADHRVGTRDLGYHDKKTTLVLGYFSPSIDGRRCPPATPISAAAPAAAQPPAASTSTTSSLFSEEDRRFDYYSDSSSCRRKTSKPRRKTTAAARRRGWTGGWSAIEKSTSDPYGEFRKSMMEMIVEKQIFRAEDLNSLLHCFLSLNSPFFHQVIVEVYLEIIQTLFTN